MNCYYSHLIEGHNIRPADIERAPVDDLESDSKRRELQLEVARSYSCAARGQCIVREQSYGEPGSCERLRWLHRELDADAPPAFLGLFFRGR